jgi:predicted oxidoreductase (fatty acid repression mutant protein)
MGKEFLDAVVSRRTLYGIGNQKIVSEDKIIEIVKTAVTHSPSSFNSQSSRAVVLFGANHERLWDLTKETLAKIVPPENFAQTASKIDSFHAGYGTVLYFEDQNIVEGLQKQFALYKDKFPIWSEQAAGILEFVVWTALEQEGLGVSLQHYDPIIDEQVKKEWNIPLNWKLNAQMPFGNPVAPPMEKSFAPIDERVKFYK